MQFKKQLFFAFFSLFLIMFCGSANAVAVQNSHSVAQHLTQNGQALAFVMTVDQHEITVAHLALKKSDNKAVIKFANLMIRQHSKNLQQAQMFSKKTGITPKTTAVITALVKHGNKGLVALNSLHGEAFNKAYINAMVKGHTAALKVLNMDLTKINNPQLHHFLEVTRKMVYHHLQVAEKIQKKMDSKA